MARRGGPTPEPVGLKILKGRGNGKDIAGRPIPKVPAFERGAPEPPDGWTPRHSPSGTASCRCWSSSISSSRKITALSPRAVWPGRVRCARRRPSRRGADDGQSAVRSEAVHPTVYIAAAAWRDVVKFGAQLALDPGPRSTWPYRRPSTTIHDRSPTAHDRLGHRDISRALCATLAVSPGAVRGLRYRRRGVGDGAGEEFTAAVLTAFAALLAKPMTMSSPTCWRGLRASWPLPTVPSIPTTNCYQR